jgi:hypothetical protein
MVSLKNAECLFKFRLTKCFVSVATTTTTPAENTETATPPPDDATTEQTKETVKLCKDRWNYRTTTATAYKAIAMRLGYDVAEVDKRKKDQVIKLIDEWIIHNPGQELPESEEEPESESDVEDE